MLVAYLLNDTPAPDVRVVVVVVVPADVYLISTLGFEFELEALTLVKEEIRRFGIDATLVDFLCNIGLTAGQAHERKTNLARAVIKDVPFVGFVILSVGNVMTSAHDTGVNLGRKDVRRR